MKSFEVVLARPVADMPVAADFHVVEREVGAAGEGQLLVRVLDLSLDPYIGSRLRGRHLGGAAPTVGGGLPGECVAQVIESKAAGFAPGDIVAGEVGWAEYGVLNAAKARKLDPRAEPSAHLGVLGMPGLTAWAGVTQLAKVGPGDIFTVDAAAGPVGGVAGQLARLLGAKAYGIAGGAEKCALVRDVYGFEDCFDYRAEGWIERVAEALPEGQTVHFENVGASVLTPMLQRLRVGGRIVLCGLAEHYQNSTPATLPVGTVIGKRAHIHGLVVYDFYPRWAEWIELATPWVLSGQLKVVEDAVQGLDKAAAHFERLMRGQNQGKALVKIAARA